MASKNIIYFMIGFFLLFLTFAANFSNCNPVPQSEGEGIRNTTSFLEKRRKTYRGDMTFYDVGLGACGKYNNNNQYVAAIAHATFDSFPAPGGNPNKNKICGKKVRIFRGSKSIVVKVVDRCGGCPGKGDIDVSPKAFSRLAKFAEGRVKVKWYFV